MSTYFTDGNASITLKANGPRLSCEPLLNALTEEFSK